MKNNNFNELELNTVIKLQNKQIKILINELKQKDSLMQDIIKHMGIENYHNMIELFDKKIIIKSK